MEPAHFVLLGSLGAIAILTIGGWLYGGPPIQIDEECPRCGDPFNPNDGWVAQNDDGKLMAVCGPECAQEGRE